MIEKELKFKISDPIEIANKLKELSARKILKIQQQDIYLDNEDMALFNSGKALRIRKEDGRYFLTLKEKILHRKPKTRNEETIELSENQTIVLLRILENLGFKKTLTINKIREVYEIGELKFFIDMVEDLGYFLEIEIPEDYEETQHILQKLGMSLEAAIDKTYPEMLKI